MVLELILFADFSARTTSSPFDPSSGTSDGFVFTSAESLVTGTTSVIEFGLTAPDNDSRLLDKTEDDLVASLFAVIEPMGFRLSRALA